MRSVAPLVVPLLFACSCKKEQQSSSLGSAQSAPAGSGSAQAVVAAADAAAASSDAAAASMSLLPAVPSTIRVSSRVNNRSIKPEHIADGSLDTAWNSATGELVGAWVEVSVDGATIDSIKMTAGHTGHGKNGEDYFTMNPRIRAVKLDDDGKPIGTFPLDITKRELQTIRVAPKGTLRITIDAIEPGSKKTWREAAISELEVWGTPAAGWKKPFPPLVPSFVVSGAVEKAPDPCANIEADREEFNRTHDYSGANGPGGADHDYPPTCTDFDMPPNLGQLSPPWSGGASSCYIDDEIYGPKECGLTFVSGGKTAFAGVDGDKALDMTIEGVEEKDLIPGGDNELAVRFKVNTVPMLVVCRTKPTLACTDAFETGGKDDASAIAAHPLKFL